MAKDTLSFELSDQEGSARNGVLRYRRGQLKTPALLLYSRRGSPLHLTPDMLQQLGEAGQNMTLDVTKL